MVASYVNELTGEELLIQVGNGSSPETFAVKFLINTDRGIEQSGQAATTLVPRTDDPSQPHKTVRLMASTDTKITGSGLVNATDVYFFRNWLQSGAAKNIKFGPANRTGANGGWTGQGPFVLTSFTETGKPHEGVTASLTLEQADQPTITQNA